MSILFLFLSAVIAILISAVVAVVKFYHKFFLLSQRIPSYPMKTFVSRDEVISIAGDIFEKCGDYAFVWMGPLPTIVVRDACLTNEVLTSKSFNEKGPIYFSIRHIFADGILSIPYTKWIKHRKILNTGFKHSYQLSFIPILNRHARLLNTKLKDFINNGEFNYFHLIEGTFLQIASETFMGKVDVSADKLPLDEYEVIMNYTMQAIATPWIAFKYIAKVLIPKEYQKMRKSQEIVRDFTNNLLSTAESTQLPSPILDASRDAVAKGDISEQEIKDTLNHFIIAAYDTTAVVLSCTLYCLAYFQDVQEKVYKEIMSVVEEGTDVTYSNLSEFTYLEMVINEALRLFPAGPFVARKATEDLTLSNGDKIPKDTNFLISLFHLHRNEKLWGPNASRFDPENFSPENVQNRDPNAFIPFARGLRSCIGGKNSYWSLKILLATIVRKYKISTAFKFEHLRFQIGITLRLAENPKIKIELRE